MSLKNDGPELILTERSLETNGEIVVTSKQAVPNDRELPPYTYGTDKVALETDRTNERVKVIVSRTHEARSGQVFMEEYGQYMIKEIKTVDATDATETYDGKKVANTVALAFDPVDPKHNTRTHVYPPDSGFRLRYSAEWTEEVKQFLWVLRQIIPSTFAPPVPGDAIYSIDGDTYELIDTKQSDMNERLSLLELVLCLSPESGIIIYRVQFTEPIGWQAPAVFNFLTSTWTNGTDLVVQPPHLGTDYEATPHRTCTHPAVVIVTYTIQQDPDPLPTKFVVTSPAAASRVYPVPENTIHNDISAYEITDDYPAGKYVEIIPASTPSPEDYDPTSFFCIEAGEKPWRGNCWVRRVAFISPDTAPENFPASYEVVNGIVIPT